MPGIHVTHYANSLDALSAQVAEILRLSEVRAVAQRILSGNPVSLGQIVDYTIVPPPAVAGAMDLPRGTARPKPSALLWSDGIWRRPNGCLTKLATDLPGSKKSPSPAPTCCGCRCR